MCPDYSIRIAELCKGADRCRKPPIRLAKGEAPFRLTLGIHRVTGQSFSQEWMHWESMSVRQMISKNQPARLLVTIFGKRQGETEEAIRETTKEKEPEIVNPKRERGVEEMLPMKAKKARMERNIDKPERDKPERVTQERGPEVAPEEPKSHGPKFRSLRTEDSKTNNG